MEIFLAMRPVAQNAEYPVTGLLLSLDILHEDSEECENKWLWSNEKCQL
jgi:hypothetical protein